MPVRHLDRTTGRPLFAAEAPGLAGQDEHVDRADVGDCRHSADVVPLRRSSETKPASPSPCARQEELEAPVLDGLMHDAPALRSASDSREARATGSSDTPTATAANPSSPSLLVECTERVYRRRASAMPAHLPAILLALLIGWEESVRASNLILVGLLVLYVVIGWQAGRWFLSRPKDEARARTWARALYPQLVVLALVQNAIFLNLAAHGVAHAADYLLVVVSVYCAGAVASYRHLRGLSIAYVVAVTLPLAAYHLTSGTQSGQVIALMLAAYVVFMANAAAALHREAVERLELVHELRAARDAAEALARTDGLTGLLNRRALFETGEARFSDAMRGSRPFSTLLLDLDHFKSINDRFGHGAGDAVLVALADALRSTGRTSDLIGRLGGEEFAILVPETDAVGALGLAERVRRAVGSIDIRGLPRVAVSIGVAEMRRDDDRLDTLIARADRALYEAKRRGRDRAVLDVPGALVAPV